jgi:GAF domain-containing protein
VTVDRQMVARTVRDLRATLPEADDLLSGLQRVAEATRAVLGADGAGLTLVHEDGPPRWVAATDAAMELLEHIQHDFGEGPYLQAFAQDRAIGIEDLQAAAAWTRIAAVVGQLHVTGVLSVPVRLAGQPVGTLDVYSTQPRPWTAQELMAVAEFAAVAAELVTAGVELATRELEVAQLRQALTSRVWIEQAKGVLAATQGTDPEVAFQQLRATAEATSRKLAEVAQEVVQDAQRQRLAALAQHDPRVRDAEARAQAAEQALQAAQADLAGREHAADERDRIADDRNHAADERDHIADDRNHAADERDHIADDRDHAADDRDRLADERERAADDRDRTAEERDRTTDHRD